MLWKTWTNPTFTNQMAFSSICKVFHLHFLFRHMLHPALESFHDNMSTLGAKSSYFHIGWQVLQVQRLLYLLSAVFPSHSLYRHPNRGQWFANTTLWIGFFPNFLGTFQLGVIPCLPPTTRGHLTRSGHSLVVIPEGRCYWNLIGRCLGCFSPFYNA